MGIYATETEASTHRMYGQGYLSRLAVAKIHTYMYLMKKGQQN